MAGRNREAAHRHQKSDDCRRRLEVEGYESIQGQNHQGMEQQVVESLEERRARRQAAWEELVVLDQGPEAPWEMEQGPVAAVPWEMVQGPVAAVPWEMEQEWAVPEVLAQGQQVPEVAVQEVPVLVVLARVWEVPELELVVPEQEQVAPGQEPVVPG